MRERENQVKYKTMKDNFFSPRKERKLCGFQSAGDYKQAPVPCVLWRQGERRGNTWRILISFVMKLRFKKEREREKARGLGAVI